MFVDPMRYSTMLARFAEAQGLVTTTDFDAPGRRRRTINRPEASGWLVVELVTSYKYLPAGIRGRVRVGWVSERDYDWHVEVAVEGLGIRIENLVVVAERGGAIERPSYLEWCRRRYDVIACGRCHQNILDRGPCTE